MTCLDCRFANSAPWLLVQVLADDVCFKKWVLVSSYWNKQKLFFCVMSTETCNFAPKSVWLSTIASQNNKLHVFTNPLYCVSPRRCGFSRVQKFQLFFFVFSQILNYSSYCSFSRLVPFSSRHCVRGRVHTGLLRSPVYHKYSPKSTRQFWVAK